MFAEAINTPAHLARFSLLASASGVDVNQTLSEIEMNIEWTRLKAPEIATWVRNEKGSAVNIKLSLLAFVTLLFVILL
jgi:hypothetical protein